MYFLRHNFLGESACDFIRRSQCACGGNVREMAIYATATTTQRVWHKLSVGRIVFYEYICG